MRHQIWTITLAILVAVTVGTHAQGSRAQTQTGSDYAELSQFLEAGDYPAAAIMLRQFADQGDSLAPVLLADLYVGGLGVERNPRLALAWLERAAAAGNVHAMIRLGHLHKDLGYLLTGDPNGGWPAAATWFTRAADAGSAEGAFQAGVALSTGMVSRQTEMLDREDEEALTLQYLQQAVEAGHQQARFFLLMRDREAPDSVEHLREAAEGIEGLRAQEALAGAGWLADQISPRERYFWGQVTLRNLEMTGLENLFVSANLEEFSAEIDEIGATLDESERNAVAAEVDAFTSGWVDPRP